MQYLIILNYNNGNVYNFALCTSNVTNDQAERFIKESLHFNLDEVNYMITTIYPQPTVMDISKEMFNIFFANE